MVRTEATADDSLAAIRARSKFGMAIAAMIRMIATTISNSISEKPFCFRISFSLFSDLKFLVFTDRLANIFALCWPEPGLPKSLGAPVQMVHSYGVSCLSSPCFHTWGCFKSHDFVSDFVADLQIVSACDRENNSRPTGSAWRSRG